MSLFARPPVSGIDNQVTNRPRFVINDEILDVSDFAVVGLNVMSPNIVRAA
jgi:hypothetical protein